MLDHRVLAGTGRHDRRGESIGHAGMDRRCGTLLSAPQPASFQHVFGPDIPAYTIRTPDSAGLVSPAVLDSRQAHPRAIAYLPDRGEPGDQPAGLPAAPARPDGPFRFVHGGPGIGTNDRPGK